MTTPDGQEPSIGRRNARWGLRARRTRVAGAFVVGSIILVALTLTPARPAVYVLAPLAGAVLALRAGGLGRRRTLMAVWHDAESPLGVERRLIAVASTPDRAERLTAEARSLPGLGAAWRGLSLQPEAVGVLETGEWLRLIRRGLPARVDNEIGSSAWFVTDADTPHLLLPGDSALGFATTEESARRLVVARRRESLRDPGLVHVVETPVDRVLWPEGVTSRLTAARPLDHKDAEAEVADE